MHEASFGNLSYLTNCNFDLILVISLNGFLWRFELTVIDSGTACKDFLSFRAWIKKNIADKIIVKLTHPKKQKETGFATL